MMFCIENAYDSHVHTEVNNQLEDSTGHGVALARLRRHPIASLTRGWRVFIWHIGYKWLLAVGTLWETNTWCDHNTYDVNHNN